MSEIHWYEDALDDLLNTPEGAVGQMLTDLAAKAKVVAQAAAPVQSPSNYSWGKKHSSSYMPWSGGYTKARIHTVMGYNKSGTLFSGVNAPYDPTLFLERPARQMHHSSPFMTTALFSITL